MRYVMMLALLALAACGEPAQLTPSARNQVAIVENEHQDRLLMSTTLRLPRGMVLVPTRADAREEFCTFGRVIFLSTSPQGRSCFYDPANAGRFTQASQSYMTRAGGGFTVNIPYRLESFPCENCAPPRNGISAPSRTTRRWPAIRSPRAHSRALSHWHSIVTPALMPQSLEATQPMRATCAGL